MLVDAPSGAERSAEDRTPHGVVPLVDSDGADPRQVRASQLATSHGAHGTAIEDQIRMTSRHADQPNIHSPK
jgi:murein tripeptide amidase MpaA